MGTSQGTIRGWLERGKAGGSTHVIVVCDTFDHEDYPVFVKAGENPRDIAKRFDEASMQRVMEVYSLALDIESQLREHRAFHWDTPAPEPGGGR